MPAKIEIPPDLPEIRILNTDLSGREIFITVESAREWAICAKCGAEVREFHSYRRLLRPRHLPILGIPVIIEIRPRRFRGPTCDDNPTNDEIRTSVDNSGDPHTPSSQEVPDDTCTTRHLPQVEISQLRQTNR